MGVDIKQKTLLNIALITFVVGVALLSILSRTDQVKEQHISEIKLDDYVKLKGLVTEVHQADDVVFLKLYQPSEIDIIVFAHGNLSDLTGRSVELFGKVEEYEGRKELIAHRIRST